MAWLGQFVRNLVAHLPGGRRLNAELEQSRRQRDILFQRLKRSEGQRQVLRRRLNVRRQRALATQPDPSVLEQVMRSRHAAAVLIATRAESAARESAFAVSSSSYREALEHPDINLPDQPIECVEIAGLTWRIPVDRGDAEGIAQRLVRRRRLPLDEILETRELAVGRAMIDIGANVGTTSIPRAILGDFSWIYAIEPDPPNYACLVRNVIGSGVRGLVLPDRVAIGDRNGDMTMRRMKSGTHHLVRLAEDITEDERVTVPCLTLDTWIEHMGIDLSDVAFIKSDTQGWDARVLAGAERVLACRHIAWQIEFSPAMLERSGKSVDELFGLLQHHFTHFIDLRGEAGTRVRRTSEVREALAYIANGTKRYTNVLLYSSGGPPSPGRSVEASRGGGSRTDR
jgi:FkbM family methyltransferase